MHAALDPEPSDIEIFDPMRSRLREALLQAQKAGEGLAVLLVHCEGVERTDAQHGYHAGGLLAEAIETRIRTEALRKRDIVESVSRAEFACVLRPAPSEGIAVLAAHRVISMLGVPLEIGGRSFVTNATVGIAMFPRHGADADALLQRAKIAQQSALRQPDRYSVHSNVDGAPGSDQSRDEPRLRLALQQNGLSLAFQPQLDLRTGRIIGAEALLRWQDEVLGTVPPNRTVAVAETAGLMDQLTYWVITAAVQWCAQFVKLDPDFTVSVNVSPSNLREPDLPMYIDRALRTWGVNGANLVIEITETAMLVDQEAANVALNDLKSHGVCLSIDDFGTGYSSMYYLARLPLDELKIDLMFVRDMLSVPVHAKIVRSLIELAQNLELAVVAEGVESEEIQSALHHLGCDRVQGYHIGKPAPAEEMLRRLGAQKSG